MKRREYDPGGTEGAAPKEAPKEEGRRRGASKSRNAAERSRRLGKSAQLASGTITAAAGFRPDCAFRRPASRLHGEREEDATIRELVPARAR